MNPERWVEIEQLYHAALEYEPKDRGKFIAEACEGDKELHREVESLLAHSGTRETFSETPAIETAPFASAGEEGPKSDPRPPWWMYLIAAPFVAHMVFIWALWLFGPEPMGIAVRGTGSHPAIARVTQGSPAERAGIQPGDLILRANDRPVANMNYWSWFAANIDAGTPVVLDTGHGGQHRRTVLVIGRTGPKDWFSGEGILRLLGLCAQLIALTTACFMAFLRPKRFLVCMGALVLAVYSSALLDANDGLDSMFRHSPPWFQVLLWADIGITGLGAGVWFAFFALFPRPSFHSRWIWAIVWVPSVLVSLILSYQVWHFIYGPEHMIPSDWMSLMLTACWVTYLPGSFGMLAVKYRRLKDQTEKRRIRLVVVSLAFMVMVFVPSVVYRQLNGSWSDTDYLGSAGGSILPLPLLALATFAAMAFPVCFAYAILRHRLFDIRVIIRQGIRYAVAKQMLLLAVPAIIAVFLLDLYGYRDQRIDAVVRERGWIYLVLAAMAIFLHIQRQHWLRSLDRHFFREQYSAQDVLRSALESVRNAANLAEVAPIVVQQIGAALHPSFCAIMQHRPLAPAYTAISIFPHQFPAPALPVESKIVELTRVVAKPVQFSDRDNWLSRQLAPRELESIRRSGLELLAPVPNREVDALIALGRKRSEEPYTSDDMRLIEDLTIGLGLLPSRGSETKPEIELSKECPTCHKCHDIADKFCFEDGSELATNSFPRLLAGRFRLEFRIGRGGMGAVYEASDLRLQRKVAVKLILEDWIKASAALDRFQRGAHVLARFQHPNVVTLFDAGLTSVGRPFLVMERLQGRTLRDELNYRTKLPVGEIRAIVRQLCAALSAAHRQSLIHRDLKPENIFLCDKAAYGMVKILDFGLAKLFVEGSSATATFSTLTGQIAGTPAYMSPELLSGAKPEPGSDIWALTIITCEMLTGRHPSFASKGTLLESSLEGISATWCDFFNWSLAFEPSQRPEGVDAFLERFELSASNVLPA
ncbi:MAG: protein kinase [Acidobacteriaceae bacterium]|nr:protein kinase [Acidobacteriaceae bacterium]